MGQNDTRVRGDVFNQVFEKLKLGVVEKNKD